MLQRFREGAVIVLIGLLPFHAFLVTFGTKVLKGPGHPPLALLTLWKEGLLALILFAAVVEVIREPASRRRFRLDRIDWMIIGLIALSLLVAAINPAFSMSAFALGFKYDFIPLIIFLLLRRVTWSDGCKNRLLSVLVVSGVIVATFGIVSFFLPAQFFSVLGYSDLHSLYVPGGPLAAFQQIGGSGIRRIQSVMSGPNQLGLWFLVPWSICLTWLIGAWSGERGAGSNAVPLPATRYSLPALSSVPSFAIISLALFLTFSRSAWIAAFVIFCIAVGMTVPRRLFWQIAGSVAALGLLLAIALTALMPSVLVRFSSSRDHLIRPIEAMQMIAVHPLGLGLGAAGPASNRVSDACVHLEAGSDPSWASDRPDLCVFVGDQQVQPVGRACKCPFLPENWYLQIGVELGVLGFATFAALTAMVVWSLVSGLSLSRMHTIAALAFIGISIAALFLHAWEDAAVAWTVWGVGAVALFPGAVHPSKRSKTC